MKRMWNWFVRHASIRKKLIISFTVLVSIPMAVLGCYAYKQSEKYMIQQTMETMENNVTRLSEELNGIFQRETDFTKFLAYNLNFRTTLEYDSFDNAAIAKVMNESVEAMLWYYITSDSNMKAINIYTPYISKRVGSFLQPDKLVKEENWYQRHQTDYRTVWSYEEEKLYSTRTILDVNYSTKPIAVFRVEYFTNTLLEAAESMDFLGNGILITDVRENKVFFKESSNPSVDELVLQNIENDNLTEETKEYVLLSSELQAGEWHLYYYIDKEEVSSQAAPILYSTLLMLGVCMLVVTIFIYFLSGILSGRILRLKSKAEQIAGGDLGETEAIADTDEIGVVTNSLVEMTNQLNRMIQEVYITNLEKRAEELKALQAMINPHFLYNSLSSIKWKALRNGNDDISEITGLLAKFYRTSLNDGKQLTLVKHELENIKAYIEIQRLTHEKAFDYEILADETGLEFSILNFLLQPLVENAIQHGIDYREKEEEKGLVIVEFVQEDKYLIFHVMNNGPAIDMKTIGTIMNKPSKGYGILNIRQRVALFYGEESGLSVSISPQGYTCFTLKIAKEIRT